MTPFLKRGESFPIHFLLVNIAVLLCRIVTPGEILLILPFLSVLSALLCTVALEPLLAGYFIFMWAAGEPYYTVNSMTQAKHILSPELQAELLRASIAAFTCWCLAWVALWHFVRGTWCPGGGAEGRLRHHKLLLSAEVGIVGTQALLGHGCGSLFGMALSLAG